MDKATLTAERARELLDYDAETGVFRWKTAFGKARPGAVAGGVNNFGYWSVGIDRKRYLAHRLAWLIVHNEWPCKFVDHINGDKLDNRICNLRQADRVQNAANMSRHKITMSGLKGVTACSRTDRWLARIGVSGKQKFLGRYACPTAAHIAYCKAAREHFGEYARTD